MFADLVARDVEVRSADHVLVRASELRVPAGQITALIGPSGSGKTLLLRALLGLLPRGLRGGASLRRAEQAISPRELGWLPQDARSALDPLRTVGEQLQHTAQTSGSTTTPAEALLAVGLSAEDAARFPRTLSGGMAQRVVLAQLFLRGATTLLVDEPVTGLDPVRAAQVLDQLSRRAEQGCGVLWVSHDLRLVARRAHRVGLVSGGEVLAWADSPHTLDHPVAAQLIAQTPGLERAS